MVEGVKPGSCPPLPDGFDEAHSKDTCTSSDAKGFLSKQQPPPATITAEGARTEDWIERLPAIGTLIASQGVDVAPQVAGIVTGLGFESDQDVEKGAKLVQLDISVELAYQASADAILKEEPWSPIRLGHEA